MAGLSVLLEAQTSFPKYPQIISKTNLTRIKLSTTSSHNTHPNPSPFLENCFLCNQRLLEGKDIYMYRGDSAFCSEECRCKQIFMDEETVKRDSCSLAVALASRNRRKSRPVASGFA